MEVRGLLHDQLLYLWERAPRYPVDRMSEHLVMKLMTTITVITPCHEHEHNNDT